MIIIVFSMLNVENYLEKVSNIEPFINQYNWQDIDFPSQQKDWKKFEQNNKAIALNILFVPHNTKNNIRLPYESKFNSKPENQVVLLMITDGKNGIILLSKMNPQLMVIVL